MLTYKALPAGLKGVLKYGYSRVPLRWRLGRRFFHELAFLEKSQWWSLAELENYQNERLRRLIEHAYANVPFYRELFRERQLTPADIRTVRDLPKLPVLDKDTVRRNFSELRARNFDGRQVVMLSTSGTTGQPLTLYYEKSRDYLNHDPFIWRFFGWAGHKVGQRRATIAAWTLPDNAVFDYNAVRDILILSAYKLSLRHIDDFVGAFARHPVDYLDGYPSSIELMTKFLQVKGISRPAPVKGIFCHSECLYDWQRKAIEDYWDCPCFDWYGMEERVVLGVECERHQGLHLCSDFGITEFVDDGAGQDKRIVATSFTNDAMPLIRYDTGDRGIPEATPCPCGRGFPLFRLQGGREMGFAVARDGSHIPVVNIDIPSVGQNVFRFQFVQDREGFLDLYIVQKPGFAEQDMIKIKNKLSEKFGENMTVNIKFVDDIILTRNQKAAIFIQKIPEANAYGTLSQT